MSPPLFAETLRALGGYVGGDGAPAAEVLAALLHLLLSPPPLRLRLSQCVLAQVDLDAAPPWARGLLLKPQQRCAEEQVAAWLENVPQRLNEALMVRARERCCLWLLLL